MRARCTLLTRHPPVPDRRATTFAGRGLRPARRRPGQHNTPANRSLRPNPCPNSAAFAASNCRALSRCRTRHSGRRPGPHPGIRPPRRSPKVSGKWFTEEEGTTAAGGELPLGIQSEREKTPAAEIPEKLAREPGRYDEMKPSAAGQGARTGGYEPSQEYSSRLRPVSCYRVYAGSPSRPSTTRLFVKESAGTRISRRQHGRYGYGILEDGAVCFKEAANTNRSSSERRHGAGTSTALQILERLTPPVEDITGRAPTRAARPRFGSSCDARRGREKAESHSGQTLVAT